MRMIYPIRGKAMVFTMAESPLMAMAQDPL